MISLATADICSFGCCCCVFRYGKWYVKIMANVIKKGDEYIANEFTRLLRMVYVEADSLKDEKLAEFRQRITVLKVRNLLLAGPVRPLSLVQMLLLLLWLFPLPFFFSQDATFCSAASLQAYAFNEPLRDSPALSSSARNG